MAFQLGFNMTKLLHNFYTPPPFFYEENCISEREINKEIVLKYKLYNTVDKKNNRYFIPYRNIS
jgi:hypothetical protein